MKKFLFSVKPFALDFGLFILRAGFGIAMFLIHGLPKLMHFSQKASTFPDVLRIGSKYSLIADIFAEVFCSLLLVIGLASRLALFCLIVVMSVAFFMIHKNDPLAGKELDLLYLTAFFTLFLTGPGKYSLDANLK
ncbi:DoxX family protein [Solitalea longa]|uniref:DoxX family protein n=1 Tax=Solitalea longa TaxID=2079460 RepID=A0A2S5A238_9SPHI|nr:DoxX family protein [Solitalea longa]POY36369.1 DoxX family protein [Solitalea longa]